MIFLICDVVYSALDQAFTVPSTADFSSLTSVLVANGLKSILSIELFIYVFRLLFISTTRVPNPCVSSFDILSLLYISRVYLSDSDSF
nr:hypothetical protein [Clostridioides sp.]